MIAARTLTADEVRARGSMHRLRSLVLTISVEFRRALAAEQRYEELKQGPAKTADIPRRLYEEFYC